MAAAIVNLDALRAPSRKIIFLRREYEVGYIPSGAAIPVFESYTALIKKQSEAAGGDDAALLQKYSADYAAEIVADTITFVARFCAFFYPDVTEDEISREASKEMIDAFFTEIIRAIVQNSYRGGAHNGDDEKNIKKKTRTGRRS